MCSSNNYRDAQRRKASSQLTSTIKKFITTGSKTAREREEDCISLLYWTALHAVEMRIDPNTERTKIRHQTLAPFWITVPSLG